MVRTLKEILLESEAADQAHKMGLTYAGFGKWKDHSGQTVAKTVGGKIVKTGEQPEAPAPASEKPAPKPKEKAPAKEKPTKEPQEQKPKKDPYADVPPKDRQVMEQAKQRGYRVPPAWRECWLNPDPKADLQVKGLDSKGRTQYVYSVNFRTQQDASKFERLKGFTQEYPTMLNKIQSDMAKSPEAQCLYLISQTGFRIGSDNETGADKKAFGASTLTSDHVKVEGDTVFFNFIGKKGVRQKHKITDPKLAQMLQGKQGQLFDTTPARIHEYLDSISKQHYKVKDFRTYVATNLALQLIEKAKKPKNEKEYKKAERKVCEIVARKLGNTPIMAKNSYIDPTLWKPWQTGLDMSKLQPKKKAPAPLPEPTEPTPKLESFVQSVLDKFKRMRDYIETNHYQKPKK